MQSLYVVVALGPSLEELPLNHLIDVAKDCVDGLSLLLLLLGIVQRVKRDTLKLEKDAVRKVEVRLAGLHNQVDELLHLGVIALQKERDQLRDVELQVLAHRRSQVRIDAALGQLFDGLGLARVELNEHGNGILGRRGNFVVAVALRDPLGEPLDEVGLAC